MGGAIYAIAGGKGGVGRTTVALNVGVALQRAGYNTALVDGDVAMTDLDSHVEVTADASVHDVLASSASINDAVIQGPADLTVVAGDNGLDAFAAADAEKLFRVLEPMKAAHDVVLVDTGPGLEQVHRDAFHAADGVVLVTTPSEGAVAGAAKSKAVVDHLDADVVGVAVTRADSSQVRSVADSLDVDPLAAIPADDAVRQEGVVVGDDASSPAARAFERLGTALAVYHDAGSLDAGDELSVPEAGAGSVTEPGGPSAGDDAGPLTEPSGVAGRLRDRIRGESAGPSEDEPTADTTATATDSDAENPLEVLFTDEYGSSDTEGRGGQRLIRLARLRRRAAGFGPRGVLQRLGRGSPTHTTTAGGQTSPIPEDQDPLEYLLTRDD